MRSQAGIGTMPTTTNGGNDMQVAALAEALAGSRRPDGAISLHELQIWLSRAGLEELARAVASLARRVNVATQDPPEDPGDPWF